MNRTHSSLTQSQFQKLRTYITKNYGIKVPENKKKFIESRLRSRLLALDLDSFEDYLRFLNGKQGKVEKPRMEEVITTNKTDFFRENQHFEFLKNILPEYAGSQQVLKFWSAGCSSGEEPYTLAMVLEDMKLRAQIPDYQIIGTDISEKVLARAKKGIYKEKDVLVVPDDLKKRYLLKGKSDKAKGLVKIHPKLQKKISFSKLNFNDARFTQVERFKFDVIFCRNVLIYFETAQQQSILTKLLRHLKHDGFLLSGHSESLMGLDLPLRQLKPAIFRKIS